MDESNQLSSQPKDEMSQEHIEPAPKKKRTFFIIATCVALSAVLGAGSIFAFSQFTPAKKLARHLSQGDKYLDELNYEQALASYQAALKIEPNDLDARLGIIEASYYLDKENLSDIYSETLEVIASLNSEELVKNNESVSKIYEWAFSIYTEDLEKTVTILEDAYTSNPDNEYIKELVIKAYINLADSYHQKDDFENMLEIYNRLVEIDPENDALIQIFPEHLKSYLEKLLRISNAKKAREIMKEYMNASAIIVLTPILEAMENNDYETMIKLADSKLTNAFVKTLNYVSCVYTTNSIVENYTGTALGVYPFGDDKHYFYYGDYMNGSREGHGIYYIKGSSNDCATFDGNWKNDKPNGSGTINTYRRIDENTAYNSYYTLTQTGNFIDGKGDGTFECKVIDPGNTNRTYVGSFTANNGIVTDIYNNYPEYHNLDLVKRVHNSNQSIFVFLENSDFNYIYLGALPQSELFGVDGFIE